MSMGDNLCMIEIRVVKGCRLKTGVIAERSTRDVVKRDERQELARKKKAEPCCSGRSSNSEDIKTRHQVRK